MIKIKIRVFAKKILLKTLAKRSRDLVILKAMVIIVDNLMYNFSPNQKN